MHMPCVQFQTKKIDCKVWHPTCFTDVLILLLPDNLPKIDARLYVMQHKKNESFPQGKKSFELQKT